MNPESVKILKNVHVGKIAKMVVHACKANTPLPTIPDVSDQV